MFQFRPFPSYTYLIQCTMLEYCSSGFPHSEIHGYSGYLLLPVAYRSLSRPSSAPDAKAFPLRSFLLDLLLFWFSQFVFENYANSYFLKLYLPNYSLDLTFSSSTVAFSFLCSVFKVQIPVSFETGYKLLILIACIKLQRNWWAQVGSNHRPYDYQSYALAS